MMHELGWIVATASLIGNVYLGWLLWRQAQIVASLEDLREIIEEHADGRERGSTLTR